MRIVSPAAACSNLKTSCIAAANQVCQGKQMVLIRAVDGVQGNQGRNNARDLTFTCEDKAATQKPAS
ncbi:hypothetical protein [Candidatus Burkholderia verschuerenii]|uniref:hypothetical protein n=1 Tax=Candidatus Burkholderia verschuerenii TaxID=242163 RepID=UPI000A4ED81B|nr:hypothetical protein [Candidatus Burkholderia verschuerenii]